MITVFTPTRNRRDWIRACCRSVLNQTYRDWEHIVYDVGDDGETVEDLVPDDPRVRYVRGKCAGPAGDFQAALDHASGAIVTPLADDDRLPRRALQIAADSLGDAEWLNGRTVLVDRAGEPVTLRGGVWDHIEDTRRGSYMLGGAVYWRKTLTDQLGGFRSEFDGAGDVDLYKRFLEHSEPARTKQVLYIHTVHPGQDSQVNQKRQALAARRAYAQA